MADFKTPILFSSKNTLSPLIHSICASLKGVGMGKQLKLNLNQGSLGGRREGSGRRRLHSTGVGHRTREKVSHRTPLHVNFRYRTHVRNKETLRLLKKAIVNSRKHGLKVLHYSFQSNHIHLILEANSNEVLTRGMRSLTITFAKGLKKGRVQIERYHLHVLRTLREAKNAILYVLFNQQKHERGRCSEIDEYTSLLSLDGRLELIRCFARKRKMTIRIKDLSPWDPDQPGSFLARRGLEQLKTVAKPRGDLPGKE